MAATFDFERTLRPRLPPPAAWRTATAPASAPTDHSHLIERGVPGDLRDVAFHDEGPLVRWLMAGGGLHPEARTHIAVHRMDVLDRASRGYCHVHRHTVAELNLVLPITELAYEVVLGDRRYDVEGPASIFVPAGLAHSANVKAGTGFFVTILLGVEEPGALAPG